MTRGTISTGVIPRLGRMKAAEARAEETGQVVPPGSENLEIHDSDEAAHEQASPSLFFLPIIALIGFTVWFEIDLLIGVIAGIMVTLAQYWLKGVLKPTVMFDTLIEGIRVMVPVLTILIAVFTLIEANEAIGMTEYVIRSVAPYMTAELLPILTFVTMAFVSFTTGSNWGVFAIAMPVVFPLAAEVGAPVPLMAGVMFSASGFGSQACFYSDSTVLTAQGAGCSPYDHAITQLPYAMLAAGLAAIGYIIIGFI